MNDAARSAGIRIRPAEPRDYPAVLRLNEADEEMLSPLDETVLSKMAALAELFQVAEADGRVVAFQIVYREGSAYWSDNYAWF